MLTATRDDVAAVLDRGIALLNELADLALPRPEDVRFRFGEGVDTDADFGWLMGSMFSPGAADHAAGRPPVLTSYFPPSSLAKEMASNVRPFAALDDEVLVKKAFETISLRQLSLEEVFRPGGYVFTKLNHGYWEQLAFRAFNANGEKYLRKTLEWIGLDNAFDELVLSTLAAHRRQNRSTSQRFCSNQFSLGLSFNNGDQASTPESYADKLPPYCRGAMIGALAYLKSTMKADNYVFADGAFPKMLIWERRIDDFARLVAQTSDAVLFIAPHHLNGIRLRDCALPTYNIEISSRSIYQTWPAVVGYALGRIEELMAKHRRLTILVQAAGVAVPLGILVDLLGARTLGCELRYFDMGQALDIATIPDNPAGGWIQKSNVAKIATDRPPPFELAAATSR